MTSQQQIVQSQHNRIRVFLLVLYVMVIYMFFYYNYEDRAFLIPNFTDIEEIQSYHFSADGWTQQDEIPTLSMYSTVTISRMQPFLQTVEALR